MTFSNLIAVYLFLGGTAAGAFAIVATIDLLFAFRPAAMARAQRFAGPAGARRFSVTRRRIDALVYSTALIVLAVGILCLIADLGRPETFYFLFMYPTLSFVSIGAYALTLLSICLVFACADALFDLGRAARIAACIAKMIGIPIAVVVMVYTGLLLRSTMAVKLWNSAWLPVLFLCSALSCGCAVALLCVGTCENAAAVRRWSQLIARADLVAVVAEAASALVFFVAVSPAADPDALSRLFQGELAQMFWLGFVCCGMVAPAAIEVASLARRNAPPQAALTVVAALVLVGGLCLRLSIVAAGVQTAV